RGVAERTRSRTAGARRSAAGACRRRQAPTTTGAQPPRREACHQAAGQKEEGPVARALFGKPWSGPWRDSDQSLAFDLAGVRTTTLPSRRPRARISIHALFDGVDGPPPATAVFGWRAGAGAGSPT